jgi:hypothetical protein
MVLLPSCQLYKRALLYELPVCGDEPQLRGIFCMLADLLLTTLMQQPAEAALAD